MTIANRFKEEGIASFLRILKIDTVLYILELLLSLLLLCLVGLNVCSYVVGLSSHDR